MAQRLATSGTRTASLNDQPPIALALAGVLLVMLLGALDQTIMAPALPAVAGDLGGLDQMPAVVTAYLVAATVVMPVYGKLGDRFGRRPVLLVAIVVFVLGAILCGLARSMPEFVVYRAVQGAGGGGLMISAQAIIGEIFSPRERGRYLGLLGGAYVVAAVGGPLVGGFFIDHLGWRWIFALYPPLGAVALFATVRTLRLPVPRTRPPIDYAGAVTLAVAVVGLVLLTSTVGQAGERSAWLIPALAVVTVSAGAAWLATARSAVDPILPLRLFHDPAFAIPTAISFLIGFALFGAISYLPAFLQIAMGTSATQAGLTVTCLMAGVLVTMSGSGSRITRTGRYKAFPVAGTAVAALGMTLLATLDATSSTTLVIVLLFLLGLGVGLVMQVMMLAAQNSVPHRNLGAATSAVTFLRQIGASMGVATMGAIITLRFVERLPAAVADRLGGGAPSVEGVADLPAGLQATVGTAFGQAVPPVFGYVAPLLVLAFVLALALPARPLRDTAHVAAARPRPSSTTTED